MGLQRPAWTICFGLIWLIIAIGAIVMHYALSSLVPALEELPGNLDQGFQELFGFAHMTEEAGNIKDASNDAVQKCVAVVDTATYCQQVENGQHDCQSPTADTRTVDMNAEKDRVISAMSMGLSKIAKIGSDKYLGIGAFVDASSGIKEIQDELDGLNATGPCCATTKLFCGMRKNSEMLITMKDSIESVINSLLENPGLETFEAQAGNLKALHALPWILIISTTFFAILWYKNGACCCCTNGTCMQTVFLVVPQVLLWLLSFSIMMIFTVIGWGVTFILLPMQLVDLNGSPTLADVLTHIETEFSGFWDLVVAPFLGGLDIFRTAATIFSVACLLIILYSCCFCCCRPYGSAAGKCEHGVPDDVYCEACENPQAA